MSVDTHTQTNPHHEHPDVVGSRNRLGVILLIVADVAFALSMLFTYFYLKAQNVNEMWLPAADGDAPAILPVSSASAWKISAIAAIGLLAHFMALRNVRRGNQSNLKAFGFIALLASLIALVIQVQQFGVMPFTFYNGTYASCWYLFAIVNTVHLILTAFIALGNWNRSRLGLYKSDHWHVVIVNVWWVWMVVSSLLGAFALSFS
jgi:heme/copper-type cytochrome/quinol oxidase subunit 3